MSAFPYCILLLFVLHQRKVSAASGTTTKSEISGVGPRDCSDIRAQGYKASGAYRISLGNDTNGIVVDIYCDFDSANESWLVFQRRKDGSENFYRTFAEYAKGFGNLNGEFYAGNELLYLLTSSKKYKLRVDLEDFEGGKKYAEYATFSVYSKEDFYRLTVGRYSGDAGDSFFDGNQMRFTTRDIDNDQNTYVNCAQSYNSAWWFNSLPMSNLNGLYLGGHHDSYGNGIGWFTFRGSQYSLKNTEMKLAPLEN